MPSRLRQQRRSIRYRQKLPRSCVSKPAYRTRFGYLTVVQAARRIPQKAQLLSKRVFLPSLPLRYAPIIRCNSLFRNIFSSMTSILFTSCCFNFSRSSAISFSARSSRWRSSAIYLHILLSSFTSPPAQSAIKIADTRPLIVTGKRNCRTA